LEVADIFRDHAAAWRRANAGHVSLDQMKVMSAIERCRTAALGGHVARCEGCAHTVIAYNSCRNRHCPKCQGTAAKEWLAAREADLLPVPYFHVVFTLPAAIAGRWRSLHRRFVFGTKHGIFQCVRRLSTSVLIGPVSAPRFPANREINREFCRFHPSGVIFASIRLINSMACSEIPYATEQGILAR